MQRTLVISDVHANLASLQAVIASAYGNKRGHPDECWFLGDLMGYGPWPIEVWNTLRGLPIPDSCWLAGNHDWGVLGKLSNGTFMPPGDGSNLTAEYPVNHFRDRAWKIIQEHQSMLKGMPEILEHLSSRPVRSSPYSGVYLVHGEFDAEPEKCLTIYTTLPTLSPDAISNRINVGYDHSGKIARSGRVRSARPKMICFGHTHLPGAWRWNPSRHSWENLPIDKIIEFGELVKRPIALNPGSVGFPRGSHHSPSYALIDWECQEISFQQVPYDSSAVKKKMERPPYLDLLHERGFWRDPEFNNDDQGVNDA